MANSSITLVDLDFDTMKESLKSYMKAQPEFSDYDFEGSNMNVLLDILSYNTFHNAFYMNMVVNESYLDSAQLRNSVVSHAKELNYLPRSARSAKAVVSLTFQSNTNVVTIPRGTSFTAIVGSNLYTFITDTESVYFSTNNVFNISNLEIYEGKLSSDQYIVNYNNTNQRFIISDPSVDIRSIDITVTEDDSGTVMSYNQATTTLGMTESSKIFFLQAVEDGKYEVIFGDNIIGRRPKDNSIVRIRYRVCNEDEGNGASRFSLDSAFTNFTSSPSVETVAVASGGASPESIESIKFYAPRYFQTQERAVNVNDYEILLQQKFPEINAIAAYGGEDLTPPQYGVVYIAVDISDIDGLPDSKVREYSSFLKSRVPLSINTRFVDPDYLYYKVVTNVKYNINDTNLNGEQIKSLVSNRIITYNDTYLDDFKTAFRYSKFLAAIDSIEDAAIVSNDTDISIYKKIEPTIGSNMNFNINFNIPITTAGSVLPRQYSVDDLVAFRSTAFVYNGETVNIDDDGNGNLRVVKSLGDDMVTVIPSVGTIDYATGEVRLVNLRVDALPLGEQYIRLMAIPEDRDFETKQNVILTLETSLLDITVEAIRESSTT